MAIAAGPRRAAGAGRRDRRSSTLVVRRRSSSTTSPASSRAPREGEGLGNRSSPRSARPTRSATSSAATPTPASPIPTASRPARRHRDDRDRADARRPRAGRAAARAGHQAGAVAATRRRSPSATGSSGWSRRSAAGEPVRSVPVPDAAADGPRQLAGADLEADPLRRQRRRGRRRAARRRSSRTPRRSAPAWSRSAPGSRASWPSSTPSRGGGDARVATGSRSSGLGRLVRAAYDLLELITFFTAGEARRRSPGSLRRGSTAWEAAGHDPHRDPGRLRQGRGDRLAASWSSAAATRPARDRGLLRIEGRDYVVAGRRRDHDQGLERSRPRFSLSL